MAPVILAYPRSVLIVDEQSRPPFMNNLRGNFYTLFFFLLFLSLFLFLFYDETCSRGPMVRTELTTRRRQADRRRRRRVFKRFPRTAKYYEHRLRKVSSSVPLHLRQGNTTFARLPSCLLFYRFTSWHVYSALSAINIRIIIIVAVKRPVIKTTTPSVQRTRTE